MVSRPPSQRPTPLSADRARRCRLRACIAARCGAPSASVPISAIAGSIIATLGPTPIIAIQSLERPSMARPLTEPVGAAAAGEAQPPVGASAWPPVGEEVGAGIVLSSAQPPVGEEVGVGIVLSSVQPPVG